MCHLKLFSSCFDDIIGFTIYSDTIVTLNNDSSKTILSAFQMDIHKLQKEKNNLNFIIFFFPCT